MTGRVLPFDASAHAAVDALLPWYVNKTLRGEDLALVEQHVPGCTQCQREIAWLRDVFAACAAIPLVPDEPRNVAAPTADIGRRDSPRNWPERVTDGWRAAQPWTRWLLAAQLGAIVVLATLLAQDVHNDASYRTLGVSNPSAVARDGIAIMFDPAVTQAEMQRIVHSVGASVVDGPTSTNAFVLEVPPGQAARAVQILRSERAVTLAERLGPRDGK